MDNQIQRGRRKKQKKTKKNKTWAFCKGLLVIQLWQAEYFEVTASDTKAAGDLKRFDWTLQERNSSAYKGNTWLKSWMRNFG